MLQTNVREIVVDSHPEYPATVLGRQFAQVSECITYKSTASHSTFFALLAEHTLQESNEKILR